jgi:hypothetical protein
MNQIDLLDLQPHLSDAQIRTDEYGRVCLRAAGRDISLGIAQHGPTPETSILGVAVYEAGSPFREIFVTADEWAAKLADVASATSKPSAAIWVGTARARHEELVGELEQARELAAVAAARAWSGSELRDADDCVIVQQGEGRARASVQLTASENHEIKLTASLGSHVLFELYCTTHEAPSAAVRCVRALQQGERLTDSDALRAQREAQRTFVENNGLGKFSGSIWSAARLTLKPSAADSGTLFDKLKARSTATPADVLAALMAAREVRP